MPEDQLPSIGTQSFESLRQTNQFGADYWSARDLQSLLGYNHWRSFDNAIQKAITACEQSGNVPDHHFARVRKMIPVGKGGQRQVEDFHLSRFGCYLIAQNGDSRKSEIAYAQQYFAIQTRRQELSDQQAADLERLELRKQTSEEFKLLSGAARQAGVQNQQFGIFHDAGYKGLYGGLGSDAIRRRKKIPATENLMDRMDATELAANQFRMTQTREKLGRDGIRGAQRAIQTHNDVGKEVRAAIQRIGGTLPENISPAEHIKAVEERVQNTNPVLLLEESEARGLLPTSSSTPTDPTSEAAS